MKQSLFCLLAVLCVTLALPGCQIGGTTWPQVWVEYRNMPPVSKLLPEIVTDFVYETPRLHAVTIEISNDENDGMWLEVRRNGVLLAFQDRSTGTVIARVPPKYTVVLGVDTASSFWREFHVSLKAWDAPSDGEVLGRMVYRSYSLGPYQDSSYSDTWSVTREEIASLRSYDGPGFTCYH